MRFIIVGLICLIIGFMVVAVKDETQDNVVNKLSISIDN